MRDSLAHLVTNRPFGPRWVLDTLCVCVVAGSVSVCSHSSQHDTTIHPFAVKTPQRLNRCSLMLGTADQMLLFWLLSAKEHFSIKETKHLRSFSGYVSR